MATTVERYEFQTEARQLLDLMVHSIYSNKDIFLRELISNASDAIDKLRLEALTQTELAEFSSNPEIRLTPDEAARTLTISDSGIGMSHDEIIQFIGTIAKSGTREYLAKLQQLKQSGASPELIGQFGVGFYASFMVADRVELVTRKAGEAEAWHWESAGDGSYTLEAAERATPGTTVTLHLKEAHEEDGLHDYTREWTIREIVRKYSDFVAYPVRMEIKRTEKVEDKDVEKIEDATLNSMKAIWTRPESDVSEEDYQEFYKHVSHDWNAPLRRIVMRAEGTQEFRALLFIPSRAPMDLFMRDGEHGINLYIKRVFIMHDCKELIPAWLRFMKGVVDSEDLSLNISREILQQNRQIQQIKKGLTRKVLDTLKNMLRDEREAYDKFWNEFGRALKEGIFQDYANREALLELSLFHSTHGDERTTLADYIERMKPEQDAIYYLAGETRAALLKSPHLEAFRARGYEVLLLDDPVDEVWSQNVPEIKGKAFKSIGRGEVQLGSEEERKQHEEELKEKSGSFKDLLGSLQGRLADHIKEVRLSSRLVESPACLVTAEGEMSPQIEQLLRASGQEVPHTKRILELNPDHAFIKKMQALQSLDPTNERLARYSEFLYGQAVLAEGGSLPDPAAFSKTVLELVMQGEA